VVLVEGMAVLSPVEMLAKMFLSHPFDNDESWVLLWQGCRKSDSVVPHVSLI